MPEKPRVLVTSWLVQEDDPALQVLRDAGCEVVMGRSPRPRTVEDMVQAIKGIDGVVAGSDNYSAPVIEAADRLKTIVRVGVGYDTVDLAAATAKGIQVGTTPGTNHHAVADYAFGLMLALARRIVRHHNSTVAGKWQREPGPDVYGKTLGIVGTGAIGKGVARRARGFSMTVLAHDVVKDEGLARALPFQYVELDELLRESDYVTLHAPLLPSTRNLINAERLRLMKPTAFLINTARGELVDLDALTDVLRAGRLAGAALDVFPKEPPGDHPILHLENVIVSPHVAGGSTEANLAAARMACESVVSVLKGGRVAYCVNPDVFGGTRA
ncbi:MAG TPA: phosphoglycerate dehydrogenase [Chloroflexota bacterium]|nr:phosphoglycerate dehydrogenase [Chloroflexota bacterium]